MKSRYLTATLIFAFGMAAIQAIGFFFPGSLNWGFHFLGFLSPLYCGALLLVWLTGIAFVLHYDVKRVIAAVQAFMDDAPFKFMGISILIFVCSSYIFRIKVPLLGDSFYIIKHYADVSRGEYPLDPRNEPLATFAFYAFMKFAARPDYQDLLQAFFYGEMALGIVFIIVSFITIRNFFSKAQPRLFAFLFIMSLPYMQLFFGYVENYSIVLVLLSLYVASAILIYREKLPFYILAFILIVNLLSHYTTILLLPSFCYLAYDCVRRKKYQELWIGISTLFVALSAIILAVGGDVHKLLPYSPHSHFLSALTSKQTAEIHSEAYSIFSPYHLIDLINYAILMIPPLLALMMLQTFQTKKMLAGPNKKEQIFLLLAFLPVLMFLVIVKFDLSAARDWDVFAPYFFILALLTISMFVEQPFQHSEKVMTIVLGLSLTHSLIMFSLNSSTEASINRYKTLFDKRNTSQFASYSGTLYLAYYYHQIHNDEGGISAWSDYIRAYPSDQRGYENLLSNLSGMSNPPVDIIVSVYERWIEAIPRDGPAKQKFVDYLTDAGSAYFNAGLLREAEEFYIKALRIDPSRPVIFNNLGSVYAEKGKTEESIALYRHAIQLDPNYADAYFNMGTAFSENKDYKKARECINMAAQLGNTEAQKIIEENIPPGQFEKATALQDTTKPHYMD